VSIRWAGKRVGPDLEIHGVDPVAQPFAAPAMTGNTQEQVFIDQSVLEQCPEGNRPILPCPGLFQRYVER
jgi:hypothetical protein